MADLSELAASQSVKIAGADDSGQESNFVHATANNDLQTADGLHTEGLYGAVSVGNSSAVELKVGASAQTDRKTLIFQSDRTIFVGFDSSVSSSTGIRYERRQVVSMSVTAGISVFAIAASGTADVRVQELK